MHASTPRLDLRTAKILVVDDNPQSLEILTQILMGFRIERIVTCRSAHDARQQLSAQSFDLVIIDAEMPEEDGVTLCRHVREQADQPNFTVSIILVSNHTPAEKVQTVRDAGANLVVKKPIAPATLLSRIAWLATNPRRFVAAENYCGPDRRFRKMPAPADVGERRADGLALASTPDRAMSQDDVDALFG